MNNELQAPNPHQFAMRAQRAMVRALLEHLTQEGRSISAVVWDGEVVDVDNIDEAMPEIFAADEAIVQIGGSWLHLIHYNDTPENIADMGVSLLREVDAFLGSYLNDGLDD